MGIALSGADASCRDSGGGTLRWTARGGVFGEVWFVVVVVEGVGRVMGCVEVVGVVVS